jgi:hypothetical protein
MYAESVKRKFYLRTLLMLKKLAGILLLLSPMVASALPIPCPVSKLSSYPSSADGCYIINSIFNNFTYTEISGHAPPASNIGLRRRK